MSQKPGAARPVIRIAAALVGLLAVAGCGGNNTAARMLNEAGASGTDPAASSTDPSATPETVEETTDPASVGPTSASTSPSRTRTKKPAASTTTARRTTAPATSKRTTAPATTKRTTAAATTPAEVTALLTQERAALAAATSVHVQGTVTTGGKKYGVDLELGGNGSGVMTYPTGTIAILRVGSALYISPDDAFFTGNRHPELVAAYHGKWMQIVPADPAYANMLPLTTVSAWTKLVSTAPAQAAKAGPAVGGVQTVQVTGGTGVKANVLTLPAEMPLLPISTQSASGVDRIGFTGWNQGGPSVAAPTALIDEPDDAVLDVPTFPEATAEAFSALWRP